MRLALSQTGHGQHKRESEMGAKQLRSIYQLMITSLFHVSFFKGFISFRLNNYQDNGLMLYTMQRVDRVVIAASPYFFQNETIIKQG